MTGRGTIVGINTGKSIDFATKTKAVGFAKLHRKLVTLRENMTVIKIFVELPGQWNPPYVKTCYQKHDTS